MREGASRTAHPGETHMTALERIAYFRGRRDEVPNQELAHTLARTRDRKGIKEIAENLWHKEKSIRSDCLKVLYEIGYVDPGLITDYVEDFLKLLGDKENRMVWGAMIALATVADKRAKEIWKHIDEVKRVTNRGTVITLVWGVRTMTGVAAASAKYRKALFPVLLGYLRTCIPRDVPTHAESTLGAVTRSNRKEFLGVLERRRKVMTPSQIARLNKVIRRVENL
jgi:hypothetical protein